MDTERELTKPGKPKNNLQVAAKISLAVLLFSVAGHLVAVFQTRYQLVSPLIPESTIWEITKQFIFFALVYSVSSIVGLVFYFYKKYLWVIILAVLTIIIGRFIYV